MSETLTPVNIITGFLGVGKTTAILKLLAGRPGGEPWAVLVNEFGKVPIDQAALRSVGEEGMQVAEIAGGCLCCTAGVNLHASLSGLLKETTPERILVEPTGLGHPERIREILFEGSFRDVLRPATSLCLVDSRQYLNPRTRHIYAYWEQVKSADVLVINKADLADEATRIACRARIRADYPEKIHILETEHGHLSPEWLEKGLAEPSGPGTSPADHGEKHHPHHAADPVERLDGKVQRHESSGQGRHGCGWIFTSELRFHHDRLSSLLTGLEQGSEHTAHRVKGVFHTERGWWLYNAVGSEATWSELAPSEDSRFEYISAEEPLDWLWLEERLLTCLL